MLMSCHSKHFILLLLFAFQASRHAHVCFSFWFFWASVLVQCVLCQLFHFSLFSSILSPPILWLCLSQVYFQRQPWKVSFLQPISLISCSSTTQHALLPLPTNLRGLLVCSNGCTHSNISLLCCSAMPLCWGLLCTVSFWAVPFRACHKFGHTCRYLQVHPWETCENPGSGLMDLSPGQIQVTPLKKWQKTRRFLIPLFVLIASYYC